MGYKFDTNKIMEEYNACERKLVNGSNGYRLTSPDLVKFVSNDVRGSYISYFNFDVGISESTVRREIDYFKERNLSFEWKVYSTDTPSTLGSTLVNLGFNEESAESFMVLDLTESNSLGFDISNVTEVYDKEGIRDAIRVQEKVWGGNLDWQYNYLLKLKEESPESVLIYVVYVGKVPAASAWLLLDGDSPFASIWGGSTVKEYRRQGFYQTLLKKRIHEAKLRKKKYLTIDASEMSRPIVKNYGFKLVSQIKSYLYEVDTQVL
jgi:hypothetical protein